MKLCTAGSASPYQNIGVDARSDPKISIIGLSIFIKK